MLSSVAHPNCTSAMSPMVPEKAESAPQKPWEIWTAHVKVVHLPPSTLAPKMIPRSHEVKTWFNQLSL